MTNRYRNILALLTAFLPLLLSAQVNPEEIDPAEVKNSFIEFATIVIVGQVTEITPKSVTISNTAFDTKLTPQRLETMRARLGASHQSIDKGFLTALRLVSVKNDRMQMTLYPDLINKVFHDDLTTYQQYLPLFFLFKNNIKDMTLPKDMLERLEKVAFDYYLTIPFVKKIMKDAWGAAVFQIHPETHKLLYVASRFYDNYDEMVADEFAQEYMIPKIVERGLTVTAAVATVRGNEKEWFNEDIHKRLKGKDKHQPDPQRGGPGGGTVTPGR